jgi:hypothetical protein
VPDFNRDQRLLEAASSGLGQRVPEPLHARVEGLCELVYGAGHDRPTKARMIAALMLAARPDVEELVSALAAYDRATVRDAVLDDASGGSVISLPRRKSGPHSRAKRTA